MNKMKYPQYDSFDDLLNSTFKAIMKEGNSLSGKRGGFKELLNFAVTLNNSRSRTSRSLDRGLVKSKFAEFAWYLSGNSDKKIISEYISVYNKEESENEKILGAYGPKIFLKNDSELSQFERIINQIKTRKNTKQAYIVISESSDYRVRHEKHSSPPCTIGLHFIVRNEKLHLTTYMRSNDAYLGLPHDLFCFTMLQELIAHRVEYELGSYSHVCTSLHIYEKNYTRVKEYLEEGLFDNIVMPRITSSDLETLKLVANAYFESNNKFNISNLDEYWHDFSLFSNNNNYDKVEDLFNSFKTKEIREIAICSKTK
jgi:thymidylate synthase